MTLELKDDTISRKIFDKRRLYRFRAINYPHARSNFPERALWPLLRSAYIRHTMICTEYKDWLLESAWLANKLIRVNGYKTRRIEYNITQYCKEAIKPKIVMEVTAYLRQTTGDPEGRRFFPWALQWYRQGKVRKARQARSLVKHHLAQCMRYLGERRIRGDEYGEERSELHQVLMEKIDTII